MVPGMLVYIFMLCLLLHSDFILVDAGDGMPEEHVQRELCALLLFPSFNLKQGKKVLPPPGLEVRRVTVTPAPPALQQKSPALMAAEIELQVADGFRMRK